MRSDAEGDGSVYRIRPAPTVVAVVRGRELAIGVSLSDFMCAALTSRRIRCRNYVEMHGQLAAWDEQHRYDLDASAESWVRTYRSKERLWSTFERQRCLVHVDRDNPDVVPLDVWDLGPA
jgi:hypothetical protein